MECIIAYTCAPVSERNPPETFCFSFSGLILLSEALSQLLDNGAETQIRDITLGRKNWLFCATDSSAEDAAVIYSMMACCKAAEVDFRQWLVFFLNNVHRYDNDLSMDLAELLPHAFKNSNTKSE